MTNSQGTAIDEISVGEINAAIPRKVYLSREAQPGFLFVLIVLLIGSVLVAADSYFILQHKRGADALRENGHEAVATVMGISGGRYDSDYVSYTFSSGETVYHGGAQLPFFQNVPVPPRAGGQLPLLFLPSDPSINHPIGWGWFTLRDLLAYAFCLGIFGSGMAGLVVAYGRRRLARIGWVTEGKVIACAPKGNRFRVDYVFSTEEGTEFDGANEYSYDEYSYGAKIQIIYMRHNPKRNDTYPLADFPTVGS